MGAGSTWDWRRPRLRSAEEQGEERPAVWPELIYDLVFVVAFGELVARLETDLTWPDVVQFGLLLVAVWWVWMGVTLSSDRLVGSGPGQRLVMFLHLLPAAALIVTVGEATGERAAGFVLAYLAARGLAIVLWLRAGHFDPMARPLLDRLALGSLLALLPWLLSLAVPPPARYGLWAIGLAIDLLTPVTTLGIQARLPPLNAGYLGERYRLFAIIVLGEAVAGAIHGAAVGARLPLLSGALALGLAFALGWTAFEGPLAGRLPPGWQGLASGYLQLPLVAALTALGAGIGRVIAAEAGPDAVTRWLLCGATALALVTIAILELLETSRHGDRARGAPRLAAAAAAMAAGLAAGRLDAAALLALLALLVSGQMILSVALLGCPRRRA